MKKINLMLFVFLISFSLQLNAQDDLPIKEAEKLLDAMNMEEILNQTVDHMLEIQLNQNPTLVPFKDVMTNFFSKYMSYESIKDDMAEIYAKAFNAQELTDLYDFYQTPLGAKTIEVMPVLMMEGSKIGEDRIQQNLGELQYMIETEAKRIQDLQSE